jgi:hypothetical protein
MMSFMAGAAAAALALPIAAAAPRLHSPVAVATAPRLADGSSETGTVEIQTPQGPIKGKLWTPGSGREELSDHGKRARTPLRVIVPQQPYEPPTPGADQPK